ncbi:hypothetical protein IU477_30305 [Nocardia cyriacigeorgica]|nr:hypothetical protein [Nocardia cyriacigeorgica]
MSAWPNNFCGAHYGWFDHSYLWIDPHRRRIFTTEPYDNTIGAEHLRDLRAGVGELGLAMTVIDAGSSMWFPGLTILVIVHPREWVPDERLQARYDLWKRDAETQ